MSRVETCQRESQIYARRGRIVTYSLADFTRFAERLRTEAGTPFELAAFQKGLLKAYFRGVRETVIVLPTGNGKTTLLAALGLYHMLRVRNASVVIVASAAEQASQLFKQMRTLIEDTTYAELLDVNMGTYRIYHRAPSTRGRSSPRLRPGGEIRVIASEVKKQEGLIPTLVLVDEYHAHDDDRMYQMLRDKLRKRQHEQGCGRMVTISSARSINRQARTGRDLPLSSRSSSGSKTNIPRVAR
jgi:phage terminase large subunit-like protein